MGLDYTDGCVNFRDIGAYVNLILDKKLLPEGKLYRGGSIDYVKEHAEIEHVKSVINLRNRADFDCFNIRQYHFPMANKIEKYDTTNKEVRKWLNAILKTFEDESLSYPILIHCLSGKDRTGIVVAALLLLLGIDTQTIKEEYLLSEGEVKKEWIELALHGMKYINTYFDKLDIEKIKKNILSKN